MRRTPDHDVVITGITILLCLGLIGAGIAMSITRGILEGLPFWLVGISFIWAIVLLIRAGKESKQ